MRKRLNIGFNWSPVGIPLSVTTDGNTYPYVHQQDAITRTSDSRYAAYVTPANTLLTFVANVVSPPGIFPVEYKWNFGDGFIGYGSTVTHTYLVPSAQTVATLSVRDNFDNIESRSQVLNLRFASPIMAGEWVAISDAPVVTLVNLAPNGSFEYDTNGAAPNGWVRSWGTEVVAASGGFSGSVGSKACQLGVSGLTQGNGLTQSVASTITAGTSYRADLAFQQLSADGGNLSLKIQWFDGGNALISTDSSGSAANPGLNGTGTLSVTATAPVGAVTEKIFIDKGFSTNVYLVDAINLCPTTQTAGYHDGDTGGWTWNGTAGNSTSHN